MQLTTTLHTSIGIIHCTLTRVDWHGLDVIHADMYQNEKMGELNNTFVSFRAAVYFQWNGREYKIVQPPRNPYVNDFWRELENLISCTIVVNE